MELTTITYEEDGPIGRITLDRPDDGNMFNLQMCRELKAVLEETRLETRTKVLVLTGAGDRFFCIGGSKDGLEPTRSYPGVLPILDVYDLIERHQKPIVASVNGYAAGYGTWNLEDLVGRKRAKEMWYLNEKIPARQALEWGLINRVVPDDRLREETDRLAHEIAQRGDIALASVKGSFGARTSGVSGFSRVAHDLLLRHYLETDESKGLRESFNRPRTSHGA